MRFVLDTHSHTISSGHAYSTITEYATEAAEKGLQLISMTDHSPCMPGGANTLHFINLKIIPPVIHGVEVLRGAELDIMDTGGTVDLPEHILEALDFGIASFHLPCFKPHSLEENTQAIVNTIKNPFVKIIGHLGDPRYPIDIPRIAKAAKDHDTFLEINNSSLSPLGVRSGGDQIILEIIKECMRINHPIVLGSDAHYHTAVGNFDLILPLLDAAQTPDALILNTDVAFFKQALKIKR